MQPPAPALTRLKASHLRLRQTGACATAPCDMPHIAACDASLHAPCQGASPPTRQGASAERDAPMISALRGTDREVPVAHGLAQGPRSRCRAPSRNSCKSAVPRAPCLSSSSECHQRRWTRKQRPPASCAARLPNSCATWVPHGQGRKSYGKSCAPAAGGAACWSRSRSAGPSPGKGALPAESSESGAAPQILLRPLLRSVSEGGSSSAASSLARLRLAIEALPKTGAAEAFRASALARASSSGAPGASGAPEASELWQGLPQRPLATRAGGSRRGPCARPETCALWQVRLTTPHSPRKSTLSATRPWREAPILKPSRRPTRRMWWAQMEAEAAPAWREAHGGSATCWQRRSG
mmetsp:Transcript_123342/g.344035  ORF Transcript_123342/g.344035 Transcript_123342/m.344035 type:complete len:353 (+) Transcript_123342:82-1140(+)